MDLSKRLDLFRFRYIFALVISFFVFELFLFLRSFPAEYNIFLRYQTRMQTSDPFWTSFWFGSELTGEVGLIFRFVGVCFLVAFCWMLVWRGQASQPQDGQCLPQREQLFINVLRCRAQLAPQAHRRTCQVGPVPPFYTGLILLANSGTPACRHK